MTIQPGDTIPSVTLKHISREGMTDLTTDSIFKGRTVALFTVPAAFSPACSAQHLPGFLDNAGRLYAKGVDIIACLAVNDPFVLDAWAKSHGVGDQIVMLPDGNADLTRALGLELDASALGLGLRAQRAALIVRDGVVQSVRVEDTPSAVDASSAEAMLEELTQLA